MCAGQSSWATVWLGYSMALSPGIGSGLYRTEFPTTSTATVGQEPFRTHLACYFLPPMSQRKESSTFYEPSHLCLMVSATVSLLLPASGAEARRKPRRSVL